MAPLLGMRGGLSAKAFGLFLPAGALGSFESIATVTVGAGGASSISFASIPQNYTHLQIRGIGRSTYSNTSDNIYIRCNSDVVTADYYKHYLMGDGATASAGSANNSTIGNLGLIAATSLASVFSGFFIDILDYTDTNKLKTIRTLSGFDANGSGQAILASVLWSNSTAISGVSFDLEVGNFAQYSSFALYGIKG